MPDGRQGEYTAVSRALFRAIGQWRLQLARKGRPGADRAAAFPAVGSGRTLGVLLFDARSSHDRSAPARAVLRCRGPHSRSRRCLPKMSGPVSWLVSIGLGLAGALVGYLMFTMGLGIGDTDIFDWGQ